MRASLPERLFKFSKLAEKGVSLKAAVKGQRPAYSWIAKDFIPYTVYDRYKLFPNAKFKGPAIIEEKESTLIVGEDAAVSVDDFGFLWVDLTAHGARVTGHGEKTKAKATKHKVREVKSKGKPAEKKVQALARKAKAAKPKGKTAGGAQSPKQSRQREREKGRYGKANKRMMRKARSTGEAGDFPCTVHRVPCTASGGRYGTQVRPNHS